MLALIKRYRELFAIGILLLLPFFTYLAHAKHGRDLNAVDRVVVSATAPIERGLSRVIVGALETWRGYVDLRDAHRENLELKAQNQKLQQTVQQLVETQAENDRLRKMIAFAETAPTPVMTAPIIGTAPVTNLLTIKIGKGTRDGVSKGMAVASSEGIIGRVLSSGSRSADVLLLADPNFAVPVRVQRSRARAKVAGLGGDRRPALVQAARTDDIEDGDLLVTAGTDDVFPKGLPVGRVTNVVRGRTGMFLSAEVSPAADVSKVEEVFVLMGLPGREDFPEASLPRP